MHHRAATAARCAALVLALAHLTGCDAAPAARTTGGARKGPGALGPPVDVAALAARARLAFRADRACGAGCFEALAPGLRVRAAADGSLLLSPQDAARPVSTALRLGPARLERRGAPARSPLPGGAAAEVDAGGALLRRRGEAPGLSERLEAVPAGAALSWRLEAPPPGEGDLRVRLPVDGLAFLGATAGGLHFGAAGAPGLRVGHATWVDAAGVRTPLPASHLDGEVVIAVPAALLEGSAYPAVLDPVLSPESDLDVPVVVAAPGAQLAPAVATDGAGWLAAWTDARAPGEVWVVAARVAADGTVLDPAGLVVAGGPGQRAVPAVAFGGGGWLVAWLDPSGLGETALRAVRVGADGSLPAGPPALLDQATFGPAGAVAAFDGVAFRLAWSTHFDSVTSTCHLRLVTADAAGQPVKAVSAFQGACAIPTRPALACEGAGDGCLVAWPTGPALQLGLYGRAGEALRPLVGAAGTQSAVRPAAAFTGAGYAVAFERPGPSAGTREVALLRTDLAAAPQGAPVPVAVGGRSTSPALAWDGTALLAAWEERQADGGDVFARRLATDGTPLDLVALPIAAAAGPQGAPAVAAGPGGALVVFADARLDPAGDVRAARVLPIAQLPDGEGLLLSRSAVSQRLPAVAFDGGRWLVVFEASRGPGLPVGVFGVRLGADLAPEDAAPFLVSGTGGAALRPAVAGCGGRFVVAWEDYGFGSADVALATVPGSGPPAAPVVVAAGDEAQTQPSVACGPAGAVVAWRDVGLFPARPLAVRAARLEPDGTVRDLGPVSRSERVAAVAPALAAGPAGFALAWIERDLAGRAVVAAAVLDAAGAASAPSVACLGPWSLGAPALSADAAGYQLSFSDDRTGAPRPRSARLGADGAVADPCGGDLPGPGGAVAAAAFDGARHLVLSQAASGGATAGPVTAGWLTPGGGAVGTLALTAAGDGQRAPALGCDGRGACLVATERFDAAAGAIRVRVRVAASDPPAVACTGPADCGGGFCVDGVCCDTACGGGAPGDCLACSVAAGAPADGTCAPAAPGRLCLAGAACAAAGRCDGVATACPAAAPATDGTPCDDGDACTRADACRAGACAGGDPVTCTDPDQCTTSTCDHATGACVWTDKPVGTACDDGSACTLDDACQHLGLRFGCFGADKVCPSAPCRSSACDETSGACVETRFPDGAFCDDGSACTASDHCEAGACVAGPPVRCPPPDACHQPGLCDRTSGACVYAERPDGTACDDGNACTRADACRAGACAGSDPVTCPGEDACHAAGACDPTTGRCGRPVDRPAGTPCDDGNRCTRADACQAGACVGTDPIACAPADACTEAGTCDPATGACAVTWKPAGTPCDDGDACTVGDACAGGACRPGAAPRCPPPAEACLAATCEAGTGACGTAPVADGTPCLGGHCQAGACQPARASGGCASGGGAGWAALLATAALGLARPGRRRRLSPSSSRS